MTLLHLPPRFLRLFIKRLLILCVLFILMLLLANYLIDIIIACLQLQRRNKPLPLPLPDDKKMRPEFNKEYCVILAASRMDLSQLFILPLAVLAWQQLGAHSLVYLIGRQIDYEQRRETQYIVDFLNDLGARLSFITAPSNIPDRAMAKMIRLFAAGTPRTYKLNENDTVLVTADTHRLPLHMDDHTLADGEWLKIYDANCCASLEGGVKLFSLHTIAMTTKDWRQIMNIDPYGIPNGDAIFYYLRNEYIAGTISGQIGDGDDDDSDRVLISRKLHRWLMMNSTRAIGVGQVEREPRHEIVLPNEMWVKWKWDSSITIFKQIFDGGIIDLLNEYHKEFTALLN